MRRADPTVVPEADRRQTPGPDDAREYGSAEMIRGAVEEMLSTLHGDLSVGHVRISGQLRDLAGYIEATRQELARLRPSEIAGRHIADATDELDAVVQETEDATNAIMQAAEEIEAAATHAAAAPGLSAAVTKIYEACSFQDLTGQRIRRVVRALKEIESKVDSMIAALDGGKSSPDGRRDQHGKPEDSRLLNGPQPPGDAISQDDVDSMLADAD